MKLTQEQKAFVEDLLSRMTPEEKIGQMNQESPSIVGGFDVPFPELIEMMTDGRISQEEFGRIMSTATQDYHEDDIRAGRVGSMMVNDPRERPAALMTRSSRRRRIWRQRNHAPTASTGTSRR